MPKRTGQLHSKQNASIPLHLHTQGIIYGRLDCWVNKRLTRPEIIVKKVQQQVKIIVSRDKRVRRNSEWFKFMYEV